MSLALKQGKNPRVRQENIKGGFSPHPGHLMQARQKSGLPQSK
jgi:hypothetical protein